MFPLYILTFLALIGKGGCVIDWDALNDLSLDDIKDPVQNNFNDVADKTKDLYNGISWDYVKDNVESTYKTLSDKTNNILGNLRDYYNKKRKVMPKKGRSFVNPDFNSVIETTSVRTSVTTRNNEVTFEVLSYYNLDVIWSILKNDILTGSLGDFRREETMYISSITLRVQDVSNAEALTCFIPLNDNFLYLHFKGHKQFKPNIQSLGQLIAKFRGPFSPSLYNNGTFEFDIEEPRIGVHQQSRRSVQYGYIDTNYTSQEGILFDMVDTDLRTNGQGTTHVTTKLKPSKFGEFILILDNGVDAEYFTIFAGHRVDIPRHEQTTIPNKVSFVKSLGEAESFPRNIKYGALSCNAVGQPMPRVEIFKNGRKLPSISVHYLGASTVSLVSFNGRTIDEVEGTYVCRAESGGEFIEREIRIEGL